MLGVGFLGIRFAACLQRFRIRIDSGKGFGLASLGEMRFRIMIPIGLVVRNPALLQHRTSELNCLNPGEAHLERGYNISK